MSKINILAIPPDVHGVGKFRIISPYTHLQENYGNDFHVDIISNVPDDIKFFDKYDIIIAHSFIHQTTTFDSNLIRIEQLKKLGKIVIIDTDDYWSPDSRHPLYHQIISSEYNKKKIELIKSASYVTTTTPFYQNTIINKLNINNVVVFPNAIDENESQFKPNPIKSDKTRFGWLGGSSHLHDISLMSNGIDLTYDYDKDNVQFVLCGFDLRGEVSEIDKQTGKIRKRPLLPQESVWYKYEQIFTKNHTVLSKDYNKYLHTFTETNYDDHNEPYIRKWTKDISKYATNYNYFDIALTPIVDNVFNNNKSQLKIIEAGFHKKAVIASESKPYTLDLINAIEFGGQYNNKGNALMVNQNKNHKQWGQFMKKLIDNPNMIEDLGHNLYETVKWKYSLNKVNKDRSEFFKSIINK